MCEHLPRVPEGVGGAAAVLGQELLEKDSAFSSCPSFHGITGSLRLEKTSKFNL